VTTGTGAGGEKWDIIGTLVVGKWRATIK